MKTDSDMLELPLGVKSSWRQAPFNIALEEGLRRQVAISGGKGFFVCGRNATSVIIGRNQDALAEVSPLARQNGVGVYRRTTGGGAVYHDEGNLNWSLIVPGGLPDRSRLLEGVLAVLRELGIAAEEGPRSGVYVNGLKVGGTACAAGKGVLLFHGTLLVSTDIEVIPSALAAHTPAYAQGKRSAGSRKGVASVPSRLTTLSRLQPGLDVETLESALFAGLARDGRAHAPETFLDLQSIEFSARDYSRDSWILDRQPPRPFDTNHPRQDAAASPTPRGRT